MNFISLTNHISSDAIMICFGLEKLWESKSWQNSLKIND